jgi:TolA-binding protein
MIGITVNKLLSAISSAMVFTLLVSSSTASAVPSEQGAAPVGKTSISESEIQVLEQLVGRYDEQAQQYREEILASLKKEIDRRRGAIERIHRLEAAAVEEDVRDSRDLAISVFERFLDRYPNHKTYTPAMLFRIAKLYFDKSQEDYLKAVPDYEKKLDLYYRGKLADEPLEPDRDYSKSLAAYSRLINDFPDFAEVDTAMYAFGHTLRMAGKDGYEKVFLALIKKYPTSSWVPEAWLLVGEYHFDLGDYTQAIASYEKALDTKDSGYFGILLYKLAWSYFQNYNYPVAIGTFKRLIEYVDNAEKPDARAVAIRSEAVEYLGLSLADEDWDGDGIDDPDADVARALKYLSDGKPYEREVLERYADALYDEYEVRKFPMAIEAYRQVVARDPMNPGNAAVMEKIISVYDTLRDTESAINERLALARNYGPGSAWYEHNKDHPEVLARVDKRLELAMNQAAQFHHKRAQELKGQASVSGDEKFLVASLAEYRKAADVYEDYLRRFPESKYAYENAYLLADCLYFSFQFDAASLMYRKVRDWVGKTEYLESAAFNVIDSIEREAGKQVKDGKLAASAVPGETGDVTDVPMPEIEGKVQVTPLPIPELTLQWVEDADFFVSLKTKSQTDPELPGRMAYRVATEFYKYNNLDEARQRYLKIIETWPQDVVAAYAAANIINSYRLENDWENIAVWAKRIDEQKLGKPEDRTALAKEVKLFKLGAQFKEAERAFDQGEYIKAAEAFIAIVDSEPTGTLSDKALQNAALAYEKVHHYDSAAKIYLRIVSDYPKSGFVEGALMQLAENAGKFFDFEQAVVSYEALVSRFPTSKDVSYARLQAASLLEAQGKLAEAASAYVKFVAAFPSDKAAGATLVRAAKLYQRLKDDKQASAIYRQFLKQFSKSPDHSAVVIEVLASLSDMALARNDKREWLSLANQIISEFDARALQPDTPVAAWPAKMVFLLIEPEFKKYEAIQFQGSLPVQGRLLKGKAVLLGELEEAYKKVIRYKNLEWTSAAYFRLAQIHELFAKSLFAAEIPEMSEEEMDIYQTAIEDQAQIYLQTAQQRYATLITQGRELKIANVWTVKAIEALNKYLPQEYPLQKADISVPVDRVTRAVSFEEAL